MCKDFEAIGMREHADALGELCLAGPCTGRGAEPSTRGDLS